MDEKTIQAIFDRLSDISDSIAELKDGQSALTIGQNAIRRDIARVERSVKTLSYEVGDVLASITETTDAELAKLKKAE